MLETKTNRSLWFLWTELSFKITSDVKTCYNKNLDRQYLYSLWENRPQNFPQLQTSVFQGVDFGAELLSWTDELMILKSALV